LCINIVKSTIMVWTIFTNIFVWNFIQNLYFSCTVRARPVEWPAMIPMKSRNLSSTAAGHAKRGIILFTTCRCKPHDPGVIPS
jgi:hypothetical protein